VAPKTSCLEQTNLPNDYGGPCPENTSKKTMASDMLPISWGYVLNSTINQSVKKQKERLDFKLKTRCQTEPQKTG